MDAIAAAAETVSLIAATDPQYCQRLIDSGVVESILHAVGNVRVASLFDRGEMRSANSTVTLAVCA